MVAAGDTVWVTYTGKLLNGKQFDSNDRPDGMPYVLVIGNPGVIDGWKTGFLGMRAGGKRTLKIPASMGYGAQGNGPDIPPNTDLYFDVTLHEVVAKGEEGIFDKEDMKVGTGPAVRDGQTVTVKYTATLANGLVVDSSEAQGKAMTFKLGTSVASGLDAGIVGMKVGGKRKIKLPPAIAYGAQGLGKMIPPNSFLTYDVELESIK